MEAAQCLAATGYDNVCLVVLKHLTAHYDSIKCRRTGRGHRTTLHFYTSQACHILCTAATVMMLNTVV